MEMTSLQDLMLILHRHNLNLIMISSLASMPVLGKIQTLALIALAFDRYIF